MTSRDIFLKGAEKGNLTNPEEEFFNGDVDLDEVDGAIFEEDDEDADELLVGTEE